MKTIRRPLHPGTIALLFTLVLAFGLPAVAQSNSKKDSSKDKKADDTTTDIVIHVVGGAKNKPVPNASVYLRFREKKALLFLLHRKKKIELDLKTDNHGNASFSQLPHGEVLVQVVAHNWQTFGEYYVVKGSKQTIQVKLHKPKTHWY